MTAPRLTVESVRNARLSPGIVETHDYSKEARDADDEYSAPPTTAEGLGQMGHALDVACSHCASTGAEPSAHLQTALWKFATAVHLHHKGRPDLAGIHFKEAHEHLQNKLTA